MPSLDTFISHFNFTIHIWLSYYLLQFKYLYCTGQIWDICIYLWSFFIMMIFQVYLLIKRNPKMLKSSRSQQINTEFCLSNITLLIKVILYTLHRVTNIFDARNLHGCIYLNITTDWTIHCIQHSKYCVLCIILTKLPKSWVKFHHLRFWVYIFIYIF